jgi:hypothetical protein
MEVHHHPKVEKKNFKEYFLEFLMIFLAVTMGFFAENIREDLTNSKKEKQYMVLLEQDLKKDTAALHYSIRRLNRDFSSEDSIISLFAENKLGERNDSTLGLLFITSGLSALKIPVESLTDINVQGTFYHHFVYFYSWIDGFTAHNNTITQLKNAAGFNVIQRKMSIDSINELYIFWEGPFKGNRDIYIGRWQKPDEFAMQMIILPEPPNNYEDPVYTTYPLHKELFTRYDRFLLNSRILLSAWNKAI